MSGTLEKGKKLIKVAITTVFKTLIRVFAYFFSKPQNLINQ